MATKQATLRMILGLRPDIGEDPTYEVDTAALPVPLPALSGWAADKVESLALAPAATDQALTDLVGQPLQRACSERGDPPHEPQSVHGVG